MSPLIIVLANLDFNASFKCYLLNDQAARVDFRYLYRVFLHVHVHVKFLYELGRYIFLFLRRLDGQQINHRIY